jgi:hypothetical protein
LLSYCPIILHPSQATQEVEGLKSTVARATQDLQAALASAQAGREADVQALRSQAVQAEERYQVELDSLRTQVRYSMRYDEG